MEHYIGQCEGLSDMAYIYIMGETT